MSAVPSAGPAASVSVSGSCVANPAVADTASTRRSFLTVAANVELDDLAMITPIGA